MTTGLVLVLTLEPEAYPHLLISFVDHGKVNMIQNMFFFKHST